MAACESIFPYRVAPFTIKDHAMMMTEYGKCKNDSAYFNKYKPFCEVVVYPAYAKVQSCKQAEEIKKIKTEAPVIQQKVISKVEQNNTLNYILGGVAAVALVAAIVLYSTGKSKN